MASDNPDLNFLLQGQDPSSSQNKTESASLENLDIYDMLDQVDDSDLVDVSMLLKRLSTPDKSSEENGNTKEDAPSQDDLSQLFDIFDINDEVIDSALEKGPEIEPTPAPLENKKDDDMTDDSDNETRSRQNQNISFKPEAKSHEKLHPDASSPFSLPQRVELYESTAERSKKGQNHKKKQTQPKRAKKKRGNAFKSGLSVKSLFTSPPLIGLDIGTSSVKYVVLKRNSRGLTLMSCGIRALPSELSKTDQREREAALSELLIKHTALNTTKDALITSAVYGLNVLFQNLQLPPTARKELEKVVPWACRKDFPFPIEETVFQFETLNPATKDNKLEVFVIAVQKKLIESHIEILERAQIIPKKVSTVPVALWNLFLAKDKDNKQCHALIDIGATSSHIVFVNQGELQFARHISIGGDDFTKALIGAIFVDGKEINVSAERAEQIKRKYGFLEKSTDNKTEEGIPLKEISVMMGPVLERMVQEIQRTIDFYKERFGGSLEKINLTGGGSYLKLLSTHLEREFNCEVDTFDPFEFISTKEVGNENAIENSGFRFAVAIGLALDSKKQLNFLPDDLKGHHKALTLKKVFRGVALLLILIMVLISLGMTKKLKRIETIFHRINAEYISAKPIQQQFLVLQKELLNLQQVQDNYNSQITLNKNAAQHLTAISHLVPSNVALTSLRVTQRQVGNNAQDEAQTEEILKLDGVAFQNRSLEGMNLAKFLLALEKSGYFYKISLKHQRITGEGNIEFSIECVI
ncbi:MAG: type IV pilus assembly protein PilM [bacterium]